MSFKIKNLDIKNNIFLAPMAGVTDLAFREICKDFEVSLVYTEMVSAKGLMYKSENTKMLLKTSSKERPIGVQIFGSDPDILSNTAKELEKYPFDIIDINMGCPAPKIVKNGDGSALMKNPKLIGEIVKKVSSSIDKPLTIKIRKGFCNDSVNAVEVAKIAEENGASAITVHGRTRDQFYSGKADWEIIKKVKEAVKIPVIGNGDVTDHISAKNLFDSTNCDAIMVGRQALGNPFIFKQINAYLKTNEVLEPPTKYEKIEIALNHAKLIINYKGEYIGIREMRKHIGWYIKGIKNASKLRTKINTANTFLELKFLLESLL